MAPVIAAIPVILKVTSVVVSTVSMIKGLKEGNMLQAVMGGIGAFTGMSALASGLSSGAGAAAGGSELGALAGDVATQGGLTVNNAAGALGGAGDLAAGAAGAATSAAPGFNLQALSGGMGGLGAQDAMSAAMAAGPAAAAAPAASQGLMGALGDVGSKATGLVDEAMSGLGKVGELALENKDVLANVGGGLLKGYSEGKLLEEKWDREDRQIREKYAREDAARRRAGYTPERKEGSYKWARSPDNPPVAEGGSK